MHGVANGAAHQGKRRDLVHWMHLTIFTVSVLESEQHGEELLFFWWKLVVLGWTLV